MKYTYLGKSDLKVSRICMGCMDYADLYIYHMWDYHTPMEELYVPHALAGVMAQNGKQKAGNVV